MQNEFDYHIVITKLSTENKLVLSQLLSYTRSYQHHQQLSTTTVVGEKACQGRKSVLVLMLKRQNNPRQLMISQC